jgi:hypothetical protein
MKPMKPFLNFREYLKRVVGDPNRISEMKALAELFGMENLNRVLEGKTMSQPKGMLGAGQEKSGAK